MPPIQQEDDTLSPSRARDALTGQTPQSAPRQVMPGVYRSGNSYSDTPGMASGSQAAQTLSAAPAASPRGLADTAGVTPGGGAGQALSSIPGVYQHGRGQYSDSPSGMGFGGSASPPGPLGRASAVLSANPMAARAVQQPETQAGTQTGPVSTTPSAASTLSAMPTTNGNVTRVGNSYSGTNVSGDITVNGSAPGGSYTDGLAARALMQPPVSTPAAGGVGLAQYAGLTPGQSSAPPTAMPDGLAARALGQRSPVGQGLAAYALSQPAATPAPSTAQSLAQAAGINFGADYRNATPGQYASDMLGARSGAESLGRLMASGQIAAPQAGFSGVIGSLDNGNMGSRTPGQQRRDAEVSASSIMNDGGRWDMHKGVSPARQALMALDEQKLEGIRGSNSMAQAVLGANTALQREGMEQQGAGQRSLVQAMLEDSRARQTAQHQANQEDIARQHLQLESKRANLAGVPPGYRNKADGTLEAIPGGPADLKNNKENLQQGKDTQDIFSIIKQAEPLLKTTTDSYSGNLLDQGARVFGHATEGAKSASQLKALEGALISKMPKMSGPQSDKDVLLYKQMAGQLGDHTIPADQRRAALSTIEDLHMKYLPSVTDAAGYQSVPSGSYYRLPNGDVRRKQ